MSLRPQDGQRLSVWESATAGPAVQLQPPKAKLMTQSPPCSPPPLALLSSEPSPDLDNPQDPLCGQPPACLWPPASSTMEPPEGWSPRSVAGAWERVPQHTRGQDVAAGRHGLSRSASGALRVAPAGAGSGSPLALPRLAPALSVAGLPLRPSRGGPCFQTPSAPAGARVRVTASPSSQCRVAACSGPGPAAALS